MKRHFSLLLALTLLLTIVPTPAVSEEIAPVAEEIILPAPEEAAPVDAPTYAYLTKAITLEGFYLPEGAVVCRIGGCLCACMIDEIAVSGEIDASLLEPISAEEVEALFKDVTVTVYADEAGTQALYPNRTEAEVEEEALFEDVSDIPAPVEAEIPSLPTEEVIPALPTTDEVPQTRAAYAVGFDAVNLKLSVNQTKPIGVYTYPVQEDIDLIYDYDESIIAIEGGCVVGLAVGKTDVTVTDKLSSRQAICYVTVEEEPTSLELEDGAEELKLGLKERHEMRFAFDRGTSDITWRSSKPTVAAVDTASGQLVAMAKGTTVLTATTYNGLTDSITVRVFAAPTSVTLTPKTDVLGCGETLLPTVKFSSGAYSSLLWKSSNETVAAVDTNGLITGVAPGTAEITATTAANGRIGRCTVTVKEAPADLTTAYPEYTLGLGQKTPAIAVLTDGDGLPSDKIGGKVCFESSDPKVATVDAKGIVTTKAIGDCTIFATTYIESMNLEIPIHVVAKPQWVRIDEDFLVTEMLVGETAEIGATTDIITTLPAFSWVSSSPKCLSVDSEGHLTALKGGTVTITAKAYNGKKATRKIKVLAAPKTISLNKTSAILGVGEPLSLSCTLPKKTFTRLTWEITEGEGVVEALGDTGLFRAAAVGTANIRVTSLNGLSAECRVEVRPAPTSLGATMQDAVLGIKQTAELHITTEPAGSYCALEFISTDEKVAKITADGRVYGVRKGEATLIASAPNYPALPATYVKLTVLPAPSKVTISLTKATVGVGQTLQLTADDNCVHDITWSTSSAAIATVDENGLVTPVKRGTATITAKAYNGKKATCRVSVVDAPTALQVVPETTTPCVGANVAIAFRMSPTTLTNLTAESSNPAVASFDPETKKIICMQKGEVTLTFMTYNGVPCDVSLRVFEEAKTLALSPEVHEIGVGATFTPDVVFEDEDHYAPVTWKSSATKIASVTAAGVVKGLKKGQATISAISTLDNTVVGSMTLSVLGAPTYVHIVDEYGNDLTNKTIEVGDSYQIMTETDPMTLTTLTYSSSNPGIATTDAEGWITAVRHGTCTVRVQTHNGKYDVLTVQAYDPYLPQALVIDNIVTQLDKDETYQLEWHVEPSTALTDTLTWTSSNPEVASVSTTGKLTTKKGGMTVITLTTSRNPDCVASFKLFVTGVSPVKTIPDYTTGTSASTMAANDTRIANVEDCALAYVTELEACGTITASDASLRRSYIEKGFEDLHFRWITPSTMLYWKAANSLDGAKDFKSGKVYFGIPYTQTNRTCNAGNATGKDFISTSNGYYKKNRGSYTDRLYWGNDCSAFVSMSVNAGTSNTSTIYGSSAYRTISYDDLRPGDIMVKKGHVVMFLYWTNDAHTEMMIIENGGGHSDKYGGGAKEETNTVHVAIYKRPYYELEGYIARRRTTLGK